MYYSNTRLNNLDITFKIKIIFQKSHYVRNYMNDNDI